MARKHQSAGIPTHVAKRLNDRFYKSSPHRYFELRLLSLLALDGMPESEGDTDLPESDLGDVALGAPLEFDPGLLSRGEAGQSALRFHSTPEPDETDDDRRAREEMEAFLSDEGLTLETLEWSNESGNRSWATKTRYVVPDYAVATAWLTTRVLGNIANTMKARYAASAGGVHVGWYKLDDSFTPAELFERSKGKGTHFRVPLGATPLPDYEAHRVLDELGYRDREENP